MVTSVLPNALVLSPVAQIDGTVILPGSKSISNRALLLAALAEGTTQIDNLLDSDDTRYMLSALQQLGSSYQLSVDKRQCQIVGNGGKFALTQALSLFLGNAGTAMRPLTAALALFATEYTPVILTGEPRMKERPIGHLVDALRQGGALIDYQEQANYPPIIVKGGFQGGKITIDGSISSQFLTALLMVAPLARKETEIYVQGELVSKPYIEITLLMMQKFGVKVEHDADFKQFYLSGQQKYCSPGQFWIEGDASSASYFLAAAAIKGGTVRVEGVGRQSIQGDKHFATVLEQMGASIIWGEHFIECQRGAILRGIDQDMNAIPDAAMTLATTALFAQGKTTLRNIYNWRVKETDRLSAMATELRKVGASVHEGEDYITITPPSQWHHAQIATYNDHRMAMCFSLVALADVGVTILDPRCVNKTFPDYFQQLQKMSQSVQG